jgi:hypothetical protein
LAVWLHLPYGGDYVYTDITYIFPGRICQLPVNEYGGLLAACHFTIPYIQSLSEFPVLVSMFMYAMGKLGSLFPGGLLKNYFLFSSFFLAIPTLLSIRELLKIIEIRGGARNRVLWYFVATPSFVILALLNWYMIGVYFTLIGTRKYLEGKSRFWIGILFGISAASNFITAVPALGIFIAARTLKERVVLAGAALGTYALINAPFLILNTGLWLQSWNYLYVSNTEDSWIGVILLDPYSPYRHLVPPIVFSGFLLGMLWMRYRMKTTDPLVFAFVAMFGYAFATYIDPPQLNLTFLPFFVLLPVSSGYREFIAFDSLNSLTVILGVSQILLPFGIVYFNLFHPASLTSNPIFWLEVIRSLWQGKFVLWNGIPGSLSLKGTRKRFPTSAGPLSRGAPPLNPEPGLVQGCPIPVNQDALGKFVNRHHELA